MKNVVRYTLLLLLVAFVAIQFVPVDRSNPPVVREVNWDSQETRDLAKRACYDCHSNETTWPWYSRIAPVSFRVADHVEEGREHLNFSNWLQANEDLEENIEVIEEGEMPLKDYLLLHPEARLSDQEKQELIAGLEATFAADPPVERQRRREDD
jgi:hypothetical protein